MVLVLVERQQRVNLGGRGLDVGSVVRRGALHEAVEQPGYVVHAGGVRRGGAVTVGGGERRSPGDELMGGLSCVGAGGRV